MFTRYLPGTLLAAVLVAMTAQAEQGREQLFNGKDLTGWQHVGKGSFSIEDGALKAEGGMGLLYYSGEKIGNAVIRVVYRGSTPRENSGVFIRIPERPQDAWFPVHRCCATFPIPPIGTNDCEPFESWSAHRRATVH